jgi:multidrug resistance efflux pump
MKTLPILAIVLGTMAGVSGQLFLRNEPGAVAGPSASPGESATERVAANGVVEGARPEAALRLEVAGTIATVHARENQDVKRGDLLLELHNETQKHKVALAEAEVGIARAELDRLKNGERVEKRKAVAAMESARAAIYNQTETDWKRSQRLGRGGAVSGEQSDGDYYRMTRAKAEWEQAVAERALVEAAARPDEVAAGEARVASAEARLRLAEAELAKTRLLAPSDGRVLQVFAEPGEMAMPASAQPILLLADLSKRRVRAFVEELDIARVQAGQSAVVTADGLPGKEFKGKVVLVLPRMGKRAPQSDVPGEYKDVYFREVLVELDSGEDLPLNLRVQTRIQTPH